MKKLRNLSIFTKSLLPLGIILIIYGFMCRLIGLYFFWESKSIGWFILLIGTIFLFSDIIVMKRRNKRKIVFEIIAISVISFILLVQLTLLAILPFTDAYTVAKKYVINDSNLKAEIGNVVGFGLIPSGGIQKSIDSNGESGNATINLTVKGDKKFTDITIYVVKEPDSPEWKVDGVE